MFYFDAKHRATSYANLRQAFAAKLPPEEIKKITHQFYRSFGCSLIEVFLIPAIDKKYLDKYSQIDGREHIDEAFKKGKGVIFAAMHSGSWELSNIICANLGFKLNFFVRAQKLPRLDKLLNHYRTLKGCKIIERENENRQLIEALKNNEAVGITVDQGGKTGVLVKFFGKDASFATGALRLALKYDCALLPAYHARVGNKIKTIIRPPIVLKKTGNQEEDIRQNLQELAGVFEGIIEKYPADYYWAYKIWKYSKDRNVLVLSDGKAGHLRQSQTVAGFIGGNIAEVEVKFKGCFGRLRNVLTPESYKALTSIKPDVIISCGSSLAAVNYLLSRDNLAKSVVIMKPAFLSTRKFDLVIMPEHDCPPKKKNVVAIKGALNLVNEKYLAEQAEMLLSKIPNPNTTKSQIISKSQIPKKCIGMLIGGDSKDFILRQETVAEAIKQIKQAAESINADILVTTSRRTSKAIEDLIKKEFTNYPRAKFLVIANEKNYPYAVGGILGSSEIIISSPESISMVSEAASSKKYVLIFQESGLSKKHSRFLENLAKENYIYLTDAQNLAQKIKEITQNHPEIKTLDNNSKINEYLTNIT